MAGPSKGSCWTRRNSLPVPVSWSEDPAGEPCRRLWESKEIRESKTLTGLEEILKGTNEMKTALQFYNLQHEVVNPCPGSVHSCHQSQPSKDHKLSWEKNQQSCFKDQILPENCYDKLPVLRLIFGFLKPTHLRKVILVSHSWKSVAEEPVLWAGFDLPVKSRKSSHNLKDFFKTLLSS